MREWECKFGIRFWILSVRSSFSPFSIISRIALSLLTFFHLVKWFLRFPSLKFWISLFRKGIISCWNIKIVVVPNLLQISFSCRIVIVDTPVVFYGLQFLTCINGAYPSFKLLPSKNSNGVGTSLLGWTSFAR